MLVVVYARTNTVLSGLGTTVDNYGISDKESTLYNDIFDAFRLALKFYRYEDSTREYN